MDPADANAVLDALNHPDVRSALGLPKRVDYYLPVSDVQGSRRPRKGYVRHRRTCSTPPRTAVTWTGMPLRTFTRTAGTPVAERCMATPPATRCWPNSLTDIDLDGNVQAALSGNWAGRQVSDLVRRQLLNKSLQAIIYGKVLQELSSARSQMEQGNLDDDSGAPHKVDEAWAFYNGTADSQGNRSRSIANTARSREGNFKLAPNVSLPLARALSDALEASRAGDLDAFDEAAAEARARLNTIFYLATLRYGYLPAVDTTESARAQHMAEGWAFFQAIAPTVAKGSQSTADAINEAFMADPSQPFSTAAATRVYTGLNEPSVMAELGIPSEVLGDFTRGALLNQQENGNEQVILCGFPVGCAGTGHADCGHAPGSGWLWGWRNIATPRDYCACRRTRYDRSAGYEHCACHRGSHFGSSHSGPDPAGEANPHRIFRPVPVPRASVA